MLNTRTDKILKFIVTQYIMQATPVPSQLITDECGLGVSSATIRNEMAELEKEGYITRPHTSAGGTPTDKGYRYYVNSLSNIELPLSEQRLISHLFHQVERKLEEWLTLATTLIARSAQNVAVISLPKSTDCHFKHLELVSVQDSLALLVLVLRGAKIKQQLIAFEGILSQQELAVIANRLNAIYSDLTCSQISAKDIKLSPFERQITECVIEMMQAEDEMEYDEPYLDGWHFMANQPEFASSHRLLGLMELVEQRNLLRAIIPSKLTSRGVEVIIGRENKVEIIRDYSVIISRYGLPDEASGTIGVVGPTRMPYARAISAVKYLSLVLSKLVAELYGREMPTEIAD
ncbi:MAG: heat-inducible transcription repressor HrcA [Chloroflexi bacterium]|nr:heat-inducible transcription repressor HrcA [Chloroflexota bacterium]